KMCRIAGIISNKFSAADLYSQVKGMCDSMKHGGPDDSGVYVEGNICLGNRRLAIQDLSSAGHQPMHTADKKIWITYNGEVYNFKELRSELISENIDFQSGTDTEVILKAYEHWGVASFSKLKGMFAFALVDHSSNQTYLVRDPSGIKPLYYSITDDDLIFSSEVKAFKRTHYRFSEDPNWKIYLLALGHIPEPFTTFQSIQSLPAGNYLKWDNNTHSSSVQCYYSFNYTSTVNNKAEAQELIRSALEKAVSSHLLSDASLGVFLSGGIDSSILTLLSNEKLKNNLNTLSIDLQETDYSEKKYQQLVTAQIGGSKMEYQLDYSGFKNNFHTVLNAMDQPSTDGINSWFISKSAKDNGQKAVLSGIGADELFGGYPSFQRTKTVKALKNLPDSILRLSKNIPDKRYRRLYYLSYENPLGEYLFSRGFFTPHKIAEILNADFKQVDSVLRNFPPNPQFNNLKDGNRASWLEMNYYMQNQLLKDTDSMSMSHGVEVRVPFLDRDLVELVLSISPEVKFKGLSKSLLINAFSNILPEKIWNRPKMGFSFPFQDWMKKFKEISEPDLYKNKESAKLINDFKNDKLHWSSAFALYHLEISK
ncbi:MAG: asparagine synthase (glutamine-hydrolyzing), partial [Daejeonella sp.]